MVLHTCSSLRVVRFQENGQKYACRAAFVDSFISSSKMIGRSMCNTSAHTHTHTHIYIYIYIIYIYIYIYPHNERHRAEKPEKTRSNRRPSERKPRHETRATILFLKGRALVLMGSPGLMSQGPIRACGQAQQIKSLGGFLGATPR